MVDETRTRTFRVADDIWQAAMQKAADNDEKVSDILRAALHDYTTCGDCTCELCGLELIQPEYADTPTETAAVWGFGMFSETTNPEVQALIDRAKELLTEGAVGVSVALDLNPDDLPADIGEVDPFDPPEEVMDAVQNARVRVRHVAIVDTPAFSGAYLSIQDDGTLAGPVVFEGVPTGDLRSIGLGKIELDESILPVPIIFDLTDGDHTGVTVGHIDRLERVEGGVDDTAPIAASATGWPAAAFNEPEPGPMQFEQIGGYTRYHGTLAPTGVCHRGRGGCYTYKGADLDYFHSGAKIPLDDGTFTRVGRIVSGGVHADASLLDYDEALARTDDARRTVAMGRAFDTPHGLLFSGVLLDGVDKTAIAAGAPSVELWPNKAGKLELKTALLVNQPAFPVAASVNGAVLLAEPVEPPDYDPLIDVLERVEKLETVTAELFAAHLSSTIE